MSNNKNIAIDGKNTRFTSENAKAMQAKGAEAKRFNKMIDEQLADMVSEDGKMKVPADRVKDNGDGTYTIIMPKIQILLSSLVNRSMKKGNEGLRALMYLMNRLGGLPTQKVEAKHEILDGIDFEYTPATDGQGSGE